MLVAFCVTSADSISILSDFEYFEYPSNEL